jgi:2-polyprenyl-3-methyl-5-hydroxy-6-metoxy-1,4-benzoquinol methylase
MIDQQRELTHDYWERNIGNFGQFYADMSREEFDAPGWLQRIYRRTIMPLEQKLMKKRYEVTMRFIDEYVLPGMTAVDIGCGTGIFTVEMLRRGANVIALDYATSALDITKDLVDRVLPDKSSNVEYLHVDVTEGRLPPSDVAIAMGVTPYVADLEKFYENVLPTTNTFYCLIVDPAHWANRIRKMFPLLNVRRMNFFERSLADSLLNQYDFRLIRRDPFATGYLDLAVRK